MMIVAFTILGLLVFGDSPRAQGCTPQMIQQMQARATPPQVIAQMCGAGGAEPVATVCATQFGFCPFRGPINVPCTCSGQFGQVQGKSR
jgi:hypothetical protein